jgi:hypothetical protein
MAAGMVARPVREGAWALVAEQERLAEVAVTWAVAARAARGEGSALVARAVRRRAGAA